MKVIFSVRGWRDPAYLASSSDGYGEYTTPRSYIIDMTKDDVADLDACGMMEYKDKRSICIDYEGIPFKEEFVNRIEYSECILFLPIEEDDDNEWIEEEELDADTYIVN
jgi:hypothetical protein